MADNPNPLFDPAAAKKALEAADALLKKQQGIVKASESIKSIFDGISSTIFGISSADWFKQVPKTNEDLIREADLLNKIRDSVKMLGAQVDNSMGDISEKMKSLISQGDKFDFTRGLQSSLSHVNQQLLSTLESSNKFDDFSNSIKEIGASMGKNFSDLKEDSEDFLKLQREYGIDFEDFKSLREEYIKKENKFMDGQSESLLKLLEGAKEFESIQDDTHKLELARAIANRDLSGYIEEYGDVAVRNISSLHMLNEGAMDMVINMNQAVQEASNLEREFADGKKEIFSMSQGIQSLSKNITGMFKETILNFDQLINDYQKNTGIAFDQNAKDMSFLVSETAEFGVTMEDNFKMMEALGNELRTTDFGVLKTAASDFKAIEKATGISTENLTDIAGEMMRLGKSSEDVKDFITDANVSAKMLGVNSKNVLQQISKNISKMKEFGFAGGEKSLIKMAATAERLRIQVDSIFDMAKKSRTIEGAMEMAAELQLAGGSFSNINPMDLLSAARKGPKELSKILTSMGKDIGKFNEKTGEYEFDPVDVDRLQMVADATSVPLDQLQNMITKQAQDQKALKLFPDSMFEIDGREIDDVKSFMADLSGMDEKDLKVMGEKAGIDVSDLSKLNSDQVNDLMKIKEGEAGDLKEQAKRNQSMMDSIESLKNSLVNLFTLVQPVLEAITWLITKITSIFQAFPSGVQTALAVVVLALGVFGSGFLSGFSKLSGGFIDNLKGAFNFGKDLITKGLGAAKDGLAARAASKTSGGGSDIGSGMDAKKGSSLKGFFEGLGDGLAHFGKNFGDIVKGAAAFAISVALIGGALALLTLSFAALGGDFTHLLMFGLAMIELSVSMYIMSKASKSIDTKGMLTMALAMAIIGAALIPFAFSMSLLNGVDWGSALIAIGLLTLIVIGLALLGSLLMGPQIAGLAIGLLILVAVGAGLILFTASLLVASIAFEKLSVIDWSGFSDMGAALLSVVPGLIAFSLAGLMFINPITLIGMFIMLGVLGSLAEVMKPLGEGLEKSASNLSGFTSGISELQTAINSLNLDKLSELEEITKSLSKSSSIAGMLSGIAGKITGLGSSASSPKGDRKIVIDLKLNGRDMQQLIIDDTDMLT